MGQELRTRYKIQDMVRVVSTTEHSTSWAEGLVGLIREVRFNLIGPKFIVEVCHPENKMCFQIECFRVKRVKGS